MMKILSINKSAQEPAHSGGVLNTTLHKAVVKVRLSSKKYIEQGKPKRSRNFFDGRVVESVYFAFHKLQQLLGLSALPTFRMNDVINVKLSGTFNHTIR